MYVVKIASVNNCIYLRHAVFICSYALQQMEVIKNIHTYGSFMIIYYSSYICGPVLWAYQSPLDMYHYKIQLCQTYTLPYHLYKASLLLSIQYITNLASCFWGAFTDHFRVSICEVTFDVTVLVRSPLSRRARIKRLVCLGCRAIFAYWTRTFL